MNNQPKVAIFVLLTTIFVLGWACTPQAAPSPPPPVAPRAQPPAPMPAAVPQATPQAEAWDKAVEAAQKEGKVTIYSISMVGDIGIAVSRAFKERYGVSLDIITGRGAEVLERLKSESRTGQRVGDIMESSPTHNTNLKKAGLSVMALDIPVLQEKEVWRIDPLINDAEGHVLGHRFLGVWPLVNTNLVKPGEEPKSYREMLLPRWKGKILLTDPNVSTGNYTLFYSLIDRKLLDESFLRALGEQELKFAVGTRQIAEAVAKGEHPLGMPATEADATPFLKEGVPMRALAMEEGTVFFSTAITVVKNAPHTNAAKLFINWLLSRDGQTVYDRAVQIASIRKDVGDFRLPALRVEPKRIIATTETDAARHAELFTDKVLVKLWKR